MCRISFIVLYIVVGRSVSYDYYGQVYVPHPTSGHSGVYCCLLWLCVLREFYIAMWQQSVFLIVLLKIEVRRA